MNNCQIVNFLNTDTDVGYVFKFKTTISEALPFLFTNTNTGDTDCVYQYINGTVVIYANRLRNWNYESLLTFFDIVTNPSLFLSKFKTCLAVRTEISEIKTLLDKYKEVIKIAYFFGSQCTVDCIIRATGCQGGAVNLVFPKVVYSDFIPYLIKNGMFSEYHINLVDISYFFNMLLTDAAVSNSLPITIYASYIKRIRTLESLSLKLPDKNSDRPVIEKENTLWDKVVSLEENVQQNTHRLERYETMVSDLTEDLKKTEQKLEDDAAFYKKQLHASRSRERRHTRPSERRYSRSNHPERRRSKSPDIQRGIHREGYSISPRRN